MEPHLKLSRSIDSNCDAPYRELLGSLMYLMLGTRPDICFAINKLSRYQDCFDEIHWTHLKGVLRYLKGTLENRLVYTSTTDDVLVGYVDSDWANDVDDRRSTSGYLFKVFGNTILWSTKKQNLVTISTTEAEFNAACAAVQEGIWLEKVLTDLQIDIKHPIKVYEDNISCIMVSKNPETKRSKHIDTKYYFLRDLVQDGRFVLIHISSKDQLADFLTKALSRVPFVNCKEQVGLK